MKKIVAMPDSSFAKSYAEVADLKKDGVINIIDLLVMKDLVK